MVSLPRIITPSTLTAKPTNRRTLPNLFSAFAVITAILTRQPFPLGLLEIGVPIYGSAVLFATRSVTRKLPAVNTGLLELVTRHDHNFVTNCVNFPKTLGKLFNRKID